MDVLTQNYKIELLSKDHTVKAVHFGQINERSLNAAGFELSVLLKALGWHRILGDYRASELDITHTDLFLVLNNQLEWQPENTKIATLTRPDQLVEEKSYSLKVADVNEMPIKHFFEEAEALEWLRNP